MPIAEKGLKVVLYDISTAILNVARRKVKEKEGIFEETIKAQIFKLNKW